jgi:Flp pilus assembly protein TadD
MRNHPMHPFAATLLAAALALTVGCTTTNEPAPAEDWFEGGQQKPATAETLQMTARVLASKGNTQQAGFVVDRMYRDFPDNVGTYTQGAEVLLIEGRIKEAREWLDRGLARFPDNPVLRNDRGMCRLLEANLKDATADFEAAYAGDPADGDYVGNLALAKALAGDTEGARALWSRVLNPEDVEHNLQQAAAAQAKFKSAK